MYIVCSDQGHTEERDIQQGLYGCHSNQSVSDLHSPTPGHLQRDTLPAGVDQNRPS